ncbi:MAG: hypothetical protein ABL995_17945 [Bryobacteraceae bacterium]
MNPTQSRTQTFAGAARGPVMMIVVGVLFAVDHASGPNIARTWPVILVALGGMKLWEYGARKS